MKTLVTILFVTGALASYGQKMEYKGFPSLSWPVLYNIKYLKGNDEHGEYQKPVFSTEVKALEGKNITLPGYMVPFENGVKGKRFMLSSLPLNACFFCGVGGPETVVEVILDKEIAYTERPVQVSGFLKLNDDDPDKMIYVLERATFLGEIDF